MNRIAIIKKCDDCPHFLNEYYDYEHTCSKLDRQIGPPDKDYLYDIPDDCPLDKEVKK